MNIDVHVYVKLRVTMICEIETNWNGMECNVDFVRGNVHEKVSKVGFLCITMFLLPREILLKGN